MSTTTNGADPTAVLTASLAQPSITRRSQPVPPKARDGSAIGFPILYRVTGTLTHEVIAELARATTAPSYEQIVLATRSALAKRDDVSNLRSARTATVSLTSVYFRMLRPARARLLGVECSLGPDSRCDLTWELQSGEILIDEIKTGAVEYRVNPICTDQVTRYLARGVEAYGPRLRGVRICHLRAPGLSATFAPDGRCLSQGLQP